MEETKNDNEQLETCPICKTREVHSIIKTVKDGETVEYLPGKYVFKQSGTKEVKEEYWTCKKCANTPPSKGGLTAREYNMEMIKHY